MDYWISEKSQKILQSIKFFENLENEMIQSGLNPDGLELTVIRIALASLKRDAVESLQNDKRRAT